jgi:glc operon protein GlcG
MQTIREIGDVEARIAIDAIAAELKRRGKSAAAAVADSHGELIALLRIDGVQLASIGIATNKAFTAARQREPSGNIGRAIRADGWNISYLGDPRYVGWDGGVPVLIDGTCAGSVAVSGLTGEEDTELAELGARQILASLA